MTFSKEQTQKLIAEALEDDQLLPKGPWKIWTSNSFRRISGPDGKDGGVLSAVAQYPDGIDDNRDTLESRQPDRFECVGAKIHRDISRLRWAAHTS